ncbi:MAG: hypothetical protein R2748_13140 [Bryobacterales bacterium]
MIVSPGRAGRPNDFRGDGADRRRTCPFCAGREDQTPPEVDAVREPGSQPDQPGWSVRVVPNRYPAVPRHAEGQGLWGLHEVVIETPEHDRSLADLSVERTADVLRIFQRRLRAARDGRHRVRLHLQESRPRSRRLARTLAFATARRAIRAAPDRRGSRDDSPRQFPNACATRGRWLSREA